jgi:hypothetical protein
MLAKRKRGAIWLTFVLITNVGLVRYLQAFSEASERFIFGLPEAFVVLVLFVFAVTGANAVFGWYYLGKPNVSDVFNPERRPDPDADQADIADTTKTEEA